MTSKTLIIKITSAFVAANLLTPPPIATAIVDMKNGNFNDSWIDLLLPSSGFALQVTRTYNSRSHFNGMFGQSWCTDFETTLHALPEGQIEVIECGAGQGTVFKPTKFDRAILQKTVDKIVAAYAKANPDSTKESLRILRSDVATSATVRGEWARALSMRPPNVAKGATFVSEGDETVSFDGSSYIRQLSNGSLQKFDRGGKLVALFDRNGNFLKLQYNPRGSLSAISDNFNRRVVFNLTNSGHVRELIGPTNTRAEYKYIDDDLIEVRNMWHNTYVYQYSESHNLTRIDLPDKTSKEITYDEKSERVLAVKTRGIGNLCVESFVYENDAKQTSGHSSVISTRKCGSEAPSEAKAEFWHSTRSDGSRYLSRVITKMGNETTEVTYHPELGQPTQIRRNNDLTAFTYYDNGLLKEKVTKFERQAYQYDMSTKKVMRVVRATTNAKGRVVWKRDTVFKYDDKGNMVTALGSDGIHFEVGYDKRGRIVSIQTKPQVSLTISYDEKLGKPNLITSPDLGALQVSYTSSGEVDKLESKQGSRVKIQIASTFSNFLETISPVTTALSL